MRTQKGYSQETLSKKLKIAQTTLSGYETGYSSPNFDMIEDIANLCDFEVAFLDKKQGEKITTKNINRKI